MYNKKYLKAEKRFNAKETFQYFYIPVLLFDSVYRKNEKYYPKMSLEKFIHNVFGEIENILAFGALEVPPEI